MRTILFVLLGLLGAWFMFRWFRQVRGDGTRVERPTGTHLGIGFGTNFFDTLGIGSFAPTTSLYKLLKAVPDELIPGTLNVGHTPPVLIQAFIFITIVQVDPVTLAAWITAAVLGAWIGAGVVAGLPRRAIQIGMGIALIVAAAFLLRGLLGFAPAVGGEALGVRGPGLIIATACAFVFAALMTLGIGSYAPSMIVVSALGMNPTTAFPIMMGAAAFLMPVASLRFVQARRYDLKAALGLAVGGIPAVLIAAFIVRSLPLNVMRWLVVVVVLYAAVAMLRSAWKERGEAAAPAVADAAGAAPERV